MIVSLPYRLGVNGSLTGSQDPGQQDVIADWKGSGRVCPPGYL